MKTAVNVTEYWEQRLAGGPTLQRVGYRALGAQFNRWMYRVRRANFLRHVGRAMRRCGIDPQNARVLDAGCGSGFYVERWRELGVRDVTGWDLTEAAVSALRKKYPETAFARVDISSPEAARGSFDCISCMDVLFHIVDDAGYTIAIENLSSMLPRGGLLVLTENCVHGRAHGNAFQDSRSFREIQSVLTRNGLEILSRTPAFVLMNAPVDSENAFLHAYWRALHRVVARSEAIGWVVGAALYLPERILTALLREGPSTEVLICRRT